MCIICAHLAFLFLFGHLFKKCLRFNILIMILVHTPLLLVDCFSLSYTYQNIFFKVAFLLQLSI